MKKLLIMSMVLLLGVASGFSQVQTRTVKTVKSKKTTVADINQKLTETKNKAAEALKNSKGTTNSRVTKPSRPGSQARETLVLLTDEPITNSKGKVTRPSRPGSQARETLVLLTDDPDPKSKGRVTRPSRPGSQARETLVLLTDDPDPKSKGRVTRPSSNAGTKGKEGVIDLILLGGDNDPRDTNGKVGTKGRIGDDGGVQDMWDDSRMKPTNGKTNVVNRRGGTRRR